VIKLTNLRVNNSGFTLVEVIISIFLLGIIIIAVIPLFTQGIVVLFSAGSKTKAVDDASNDLISGLKNSETTTNSSITFKDIDDSTKNKTIGVYKHEVTAPYQQPDKSSRECKIDYYSYPDE